MRERAVSDYSGKFPLHVYPCHKDNPAFQCMKLVPCWDQNVFLYRVFFSVLCRQYKVFLTVSTLLNAITFAFLKQNFIFTYGFTVKLHYPWLRVLQLSIACWQLSPDEFAELDSLEDLQLGHNQLTSLNGSLAPLRSLRCLNLTSNLLQEFSLQEIQGLRRLRIIDLSYNKISHLSGRMEV